MDGDGYSMLGGHFIRRHENLLPIPYISSNRISFPKKQNEVWSLTNRVAVPASRHSHGPLWRRVSAMAVTSW